MPGYGITPEIGTSGLHHAPLRLAVFRAAVKILTSWRVSSSRAMNSFLDRANPVAR
jgi:hypothetical protein